MSTRRVGQGRNTYATRLLGPQYQSQAIARGPAAYYRHGEAVGSTTMVDLSGNSRNGAYQNSPTLGQPALIANDSDTAVQFASASQQYGEVGFASWMSGWTAFTIMGWIKRAASGSSHTIAARDLTGGNGPWRLRVNSSDKLSFIVWHTGAQELVGVTSLSASTRYHYAARYSGSTMSVFLNGASDNSASASGALNSVDSPNLRIGAYGSMFELFNGIEDETQIYTRSLTDAEILADYQAGA